MALTPPLPRLYNSYGINFSLYGRLIQRCADRHLTRQGEQVHARLILSATTADNFLGSKLIGFYSKNRRLSLARHVFDQIPQKNTFAFNAFLIACTSNNQHAQTLELFTSLLSRGAFRWDLADVKPDGVTLSVVLKSMSAAALDRPRWAQILHCYVVKCGLDLNVFVGNGLVTYYSRCGDVVSARALFDEMPERDLVSWNSMISGYSQAGIFEECKDLYRIMLDMEDIRPNGVTAVSVLLACAQSSDLLTGMAVHQYVTENGIEMDLSLGNSIIGVYAKCGSLDRARELFEEMSEKDEITYGTIISGYMIHGFVEEAMMIFRGAKNAGLSCWNAVISGSVQNKQHERAVDLFLEMQRSGFKPDTVTLSSVLPSIPFVSHLKGGKEIHAYAVKNDYHKNFYVVTTMIDVYAKLGLLRSAQRIFDLEDHKSVIVWTAIISAYASHGDGNSALSLFQEMLNSKIKPDAVTFTAVLAACAHSGLIEEALEIFSCLLPKYGIQPLPNHYACVVACLSRVGKLSEAVEFVKKMPHKPTAPIWGALLSGASEAGDVELAKFVCDYLFVLEPENPTNYIVLASLYSKAGRWEEAESVRDIMAKRGFKKVAGSSRIETSGGSQSFIEESATKESIQNIFNIS